MKKLVLAAAIMMLVPFSAFALDSMNDDALDKMTAQEGVVITFDNVVINQTPADVAWRDSDGIGGTTAAGRVYVDYGTAGHDTITITQNMTIDVATTTTALTLDDNGTAGVTTDDTIIPATTSFVKIGLPSISQSASAKTMTIAMDGAAVDAAAPVTGALGTMFQDGGSSTVSGSVYIYAH